jgi:hypothetical protein
MRDRSNAPEWPRDLPIETVKKLTAGAYPPRWNLSAFAG